MNTSEPKSTSITDAEKYWEELLRNELESFIIETTAEILAIIALLAVISNIFVCFVVLKYRRLRQHGANKIIASWLIANSIFMFSSPFVLPTGLGVRFFQSYEWLCRFKQLNVVAFLGTALFVVLLTFQWYFKFYYPSVSSKFDRTITYYICSVCALLVLFFTEGMVVCECYLRLESLNYYIVLLLFLAFISFMTVMNIIHICKKRLLDNGYDKNVAYIMSNVFFFSHLLLLLVIFVYSLSSGEIYFLIAMCISFMLILICPFYFFYVMYKCDNKFSALTNHVVSCRCTKYTDDELFDQPMHFEKQYLQENEQV